MNGDWSVLIHSASLVFMPFVSKPIATADQRIHLPKALVEMAVKVSKNARRVRVHLVECAHEQFRATRRVEEITHEAEYPHNVSNETKTNLPIRAVCRRGCGAVPQVRRVPQSEHSRGAQREGRDLDGDHRRRRLNWRTNREARPIVTGNDVWKR